MSKIVQVTELEVEEHDFAMLQNERLERALEFLEEHGAAEDLCEAVLQAITDNENWATTSLSTKGSA
jgi:transcriptional regulator of met regulon